ncbi:hypothetical protein H6775_02160 [Candidatus Nomurabacteria bacterium]|nr:hypothetical protein [Candidatus Nomurabacteria bacterium]
MKTTFFMLLFFVTTYFVENLFAQTTNPSWKEVFDPKNTIPFNDPVEGTIFQSGYDLLEINLDGYMFELWVKFDLEKVQGIDLSLMVIQFTRVVSYDTSNESKSKIRKLILDGWKLFPEERAVTKIVTIDILRSPYRYVVTPPNIISVKLFIPKEFYQSQEGDIINVFPIGIGYRKCQPIETPAIRKVEPIATTTNPNRAP